MLDLFSGTGSLGLEALSRGASQVCFVDRDTGESLDDRKINVSVLVEGESPIYYSCDESGCFTLEYNNRTLSFVVEAPGYHSDTIVRILNKFNRDVLVRLRPDVKLD